MGINFDPDNFINKYTSFIENCIPAVHYISRETQFNNGKMVVLRANCTASNPHVPLDDSQIIGNTYFNSAYIGGDMQGLRDVPVGTALENFTIQSGDGQFTAAASISMLDAETAFAGGTVEERPGRPTPPILKVEPGEGDPLYYVPGSVEISGWGGLGDNVSLSGWVMLDGEAATPLHGMRPPGMDAISAVTLSAPLASTDEDEIALFQAFFSKIPGVSQYDAGIYELQKYGEGPEHTEWIKKLGIGASSDESRMEAVEGILNGMNEATP